MIKPIPLGRKDDWRPLGELRNSRRATISEIDAEQGTATAVLTDGSKTTLFLGRLMSLDELAFYRWHPDPAQLQPAVGQEIFFSLATGKFAPADVVDPSPKSRPVETPPTPVEPEFSPPVVQSEVETRRDVTAEFRAFASRPTGIDFSE